MSGERDASEPRRTEPTLESLPDPRDRPWLTVAELAGITGEGEKVIRAALDLGQLPVLRIGRYLRIPTAALLRTLEIESEPLEDRDGTPDEGGTVHVLNQGA